MKWVYDDGGRRAAGYTGYAGDCVVRAVAIAARLSYEEVYEALHCGMREQRKTRRSGASTPPRDGVSVRREWFKRYMQGLGFRWTATMRIGSGCLVHLHDGELPMGRLVVSVSKHYTAVIDGVIRDTHDPQREEHVVEQFPGWHFARLKPGYWINENGVCHIQRRCVYGYWMLM